MSKSLTIKNVTKLYGEFKAIDNVSLKINPGEFFTLLGPSGCGKTTLLRMIAGFNTIEDGTISFDDDVINNIPAHKRDIGMVFQNYAIFPHLTVFDNVAYGLKARKVEKEEITKEVLKVLDLVKMTEYKDRQPQQLSGGQQQRIALARAIVIKPAVLLMDEPLSNLDAKLRVEMRTVIKKIQNHLNITTVYVTHDQEEALAISDRIAVLNKGHVFQIGTPTEIYSKPNNPFVANFIGTSNFLESEIKDSGLFFLGKKIHTIKKLTEKNGDYLISVRPEEVTITEDKENSIPGTITFFTFLGDFINYEIELENKQIVQVNEYTKEVKFIRQKGDKVNLILDENNMRLYENTEKQELGK